MSKQRCLSFSLLKNQLLSSHRLLTCRSFQRVAPASNNQCSRSNSLGSANLSYSYKRNYSISTSQEIITTMFEENTSEQKLLFTPGPLNTSYDTKQTMLTDWGSRDAFFMNTVEQVRKDLLKIANLSENEYTSILMQGSGTFAVESVLSSSIPHENAKVLVIANGSYGKRIESIIERFNIKECHTLDLPQDRPVDKELVEKKLKALPGITNVAIVHSETSSGVVNPVEDIGQMVARLHPNATYFVDAMSSFGGMPLDIKNGNIHFMVSSANKCLEGVPGFSFIIANREKLQLCENVSRSFSFDIYQQNQVMEKTGQFRFTPSTHAIVAFHQALKNFFKQGGLDARAERYKKNNNLVREELVKLGLKPLLPSKYQGPFITSFHYPQHENFIFEEFYSRLNSYGLCIYPGKVTELDCFRIGNIGQLYPRHIIQLAKCTNAVLKDMGVDLK